MSQVGRVDLYIKILIMGRVIYESIHKKYVNVAVAVWSISNSFKKLAFWLLITYLIRYTLLVGHS